MDKAALVKGLHNVIAAYEREERPFSLVMLVPVVPDLTSDRFTLIVSAPWLDRYSPKEAISRLVKRLVEEFGSSQAPEFRSIARVSILNTTDRMVRAITSAFSISRGDVEIHGSMVNDVPIERAIILESHRPPLA